MRLKFVVRAFKTLAILFSMASLVSPAFGGRAFVQSVDACFQRTYSKKHMEKHPQQTVTFIQIMHLARENSQDSNDTTPRAPSTIIHAIAQFKEDPNVYRGFLSCFAENSTCHAEGGWGSAEIFRNDKGEILLNAAPSEGGHFRVDNWWAGEFVDDEEDMDFRRVGVAPDDRLFRLPEVDMNHCLAVFDVGKKRN